MERLFKMIYWTGVAIEILVRLPYNRQRRRIPKRDQRVTATEHALFAGLSIGMSFLPLLYTLTPWLDRANYHLSPSTNARLGRTGTFLLGAALWLFWRSHRDLGTNWSPSLEIAEQHTLTIEGIYHVIRHPMYASQWLWGLAQPLLLHNWIAGFASLVVFLPFYLIRVPREERMMLDHFGDAYRTYCTQTGRILPRLRG